MYDSTTANDIPITARIVAGYIDRGFQWSVQDWNRFPNAKKVGIATVASTMSGKCLDVEKFDALPVEAPGWVAKARRGWDPYPWVYCSLDTWPYVVDEFIGQGVPEPFWWIAAYPGNGANLYGGTISHQYAGSSTSGGHYDLSVVADYVPGLDSPNTTLPTHSAPSGKVITMRIVKSPSSPRCYVIAGPQKMYIATSGELADWLAMCGQTQVDVRGQYTIDRIPEVKRLP